jgi:hypothetical protein
MARQAMGLPARQLVSYRNAAMAAPENNCILTFALLQGSYGDTAKAMGANQTAKALRWIKRDAIHYSRLAVYTRPIL